MERLLPTQISTCVYIMGMNSGGALEEKGSIARSPRHVSLPLLNDFVKTVYASDRRNFALTDTGALFSWGSEPLGRKSTTHAAQFKPTRIKSIKHPIAKVANGSKHSLLLTTDRCVYSFGDAADGKLGLKKRVRGSVISPQKMNVQNCLDIACGVSSSTLLLANGEIVTNGLTSGSTRRRGVAYIPCIFRHPVKVVSIACGGCHSVALSSDGKCFTWGCVENGRLGHGSFPSSIDMVSSPKLVEMFCAQEIVIMAVACGSSHNLLISSSGKLFGFGWSCYGQCGSNEDVLAPTLISDVQEAISQVSCGFAHSTFITKYSGHLYSFGFNEDGQLGLGNEDNTAIPTRVYFNDEQVKSVVHVDCGNLHTIAITIPCTIVEFRRRQDEMALKQRAVAIVQRFSRKLLFRRRQEKMDLISEELMYGTDNSIEGPHSTNTNDDEIACSDSTSLSSQSSWELSFGKDSNQMTAFPSIFQETLAMEAEEEISTIITRRLERNVIAVQARKMRIYIELLRRLEVCQMYAEDALSKKNKKIRIESARNRLRQKEIAIEEKKQRDNLARKKRCEQRQHESVEKKVQHVVTSKSKRVRRARTSATPMKRGAKPSLEEKHVPAPAPQPTIPRLPSKNRNERLLRQREERLRRKELEEKEERDRKKRSLNEQYAQTQRHQERDKTLTMIQSQKLKSLIIEERRRNDGLLRDLKNNCHLKKNETEVATDKEEFKSVRQWKRITTG